MEMMNSTPVNRGVWWGLVRQLEDLGYADDICYKAHSHKDTQDQINVLIVTATHIELKINTTKTK